VAQDQNGARVFKRKIDHPKGLVIVVDDKVVRVRFSKHTNSWLEVRVDAPDDVDVFREESFDGEAASA
jgi:hypothetical protein